MVLTGGARQDRGMRIRRLWGLALAALLVAGFAPVTPVSAALVNGATKPKKSDAAISVLNTLVVKGRAPKTGYTRAQFGAAWKDVDGNGCDTRNDILKRDLTGIIYKSGSCVVASGTLDDPYSGKIIAFERGVATSSEVQIDHVVALSDAWQKGAFAWTVAKRTNLANDPLELLAVDGPLNGQKSDGDAATWLPPNKAYRCPYVARQVAVKSKYGIWVTQAEKDAIAKILATCPNQLIPSA